MNISKLFFCVLAFIWGILTSIILYRISNKDEIGGFLLGSQIFIGFLGYITMVLVVYNIQYYNPEFDLEKLEKKRDEILDLVKEKTK